MIVNCQKIVKNFDTPSGIINALKEISFYIEKGSITGLLGPDGSGKTTLLRILTGLYKADSGYAEVLNLDIKKNAKKIQAEIGYMPQKFGLYETLSVAENMDLYSRLYALPINLKKERTKELLQMTNLSEFTKRMVGNLSGGMKQKLALACILLSRPPLLLLDEPTVGVDVLSRRELWKIIQELAKKENMTFLVSTSYLDEAEYCNKAIILYDGKIIIDDTPKSISEKAANYIKNPNFEHGFLVALTGEIPPEIQRKKLENNPEIVIKVKNLTKKFGSFTAVDNLSFDVKKGEIFGLLGANGAGKTTTFRMLCGLSAANIGELEVAGYNININPEKARAKLGYVAQKFSLYSDLTVYSNLEFFGAAYGLTGEKLKNAINNMLNEFDLKKYRDVDVTKLPLGFKQRLSMACALIHSPDILFLDEATSGADPITRRDFWKRIISLTETGVTVIITTHFLEEANLCDRVLIMDNGKTAILGTPKEILEKGKANNFNDAFINLISIKK